MKHMLYFALYMIALNSPRAAAAASRGLYINNTDPEVLGGTSHYCYRTCIANDVRTCYYEFALVEWSTMSSQCGACPFTVEDCYNRGCLTAGGDIRIVNVVNFMLPGPSIQVCKGDIIQVNLTNAATSEVITIHWHGMSQIDTPYMDGVPFLTQCPIQPGNTFMYNFTADPYGTFFWHAHVGFLEADGFHGSLIIRKPNDTNAIYYDYDFAEHVMIIWHWWNVSTASVLKTNMFRGIVPTPYSITINGYAATLKYTKNNEDYYTPRAKFTVTKGRRYRFRTIDNSALYCPVQISVDNHSLTMIATDGATFEPVKVDTFIINAGQRFDFIVEANQEVKNYWIRFRGLGLCNLNDKISGLAILHYKGAGTSDPSETTEYDDANRSGTLMNPVAELLTDYSNNTLIRAADLNNTVSDAQIISGKPNQIIYIPIALNVYPNYQPQGPYAQFNEISYTPLSVPPLTQYNEISPDTYCTQYNDRAKRCYNGFCTCPYIYKVKKNILLEIVLINIGPSFDDHPIHFHGHYLRIVAMEPANTSSTVNEVRRRNEAGLIAKNLKTAPLADSIAVPARGVAILRVRTDNPGFWFFHCHVSSHLDEGMAAVLMVGEHREMVQAPSNFPTCSGDYDITKTELKHQHDFQYESRNNFRNTAPHNFENRN